jgi:uncharacterized 2Fe-2S/4Fe-4S cluster protein (DUF4445 family)
MYHINFEPLGLSTFVAPGTTIAEAAENLDIAMRLDCGGSGLCAKCRVIAIPASNLSHPTESELDVFSPSEISQSYRLSCQALIQGNVTVTLPKQAVDRDEAIEKGISGDFYPTDPMVSRIELPSVKSPTHLDGFDLTSWTIGRVQKTIGQQVRFDNLEALRQLSEVGVDGQAATVVHHETQGVTAVMAGHNNRSLGVAVDAGTTTLAAYLCDFTTGRLVAKAASMNPQRRYGEDVISRISFADQHRHGLSTLNTKIIDAINHLIIRCLDQVDATTLDVDEVVIAGNTTMERIIIGFHPRGLGVSPYLPIFRAAQDIKARDLGLKINPGTNVFVFPTISGFVGGDTVSAGIADAICQCEGICLLVDIGTNGELMLGNRKKIWATSCATGPALEGAQISCGMRAVSGAIYKVEIDSGDLNPRFRVIGEEQGIAPIGLCGSGIIDAMAAMRRAGILLPNGRLKEGMPGVIEDEQGIGRKFILASAEQSGIGREISILLEDIRQFQLAKAALSVGIEMLMLKAGVKQVDRTILTGSFGVKFDWKNAIDVGMVPSAAFSSEVLSLENLAGVGAVMALLDKKQRAAASELASEASVVDLATDPEFALRFAEGTLFPKKMRDLKIMRESNTLEA